MVRCSICGEKKSKDEDFKINALRKMALRSPQTRSELTNKVKGEFPDCEVIECNPTQIAFKIGEKRLPEEGFLTVK